MSRGLVRLLGIVAVRGSLVFLGFMLGMLSGCGGTSSPDDSPFIRVTPESDWFVGKYRRETDDANTVRQDIFTGEALNFSGTPQWTVTVFPPDAAVPVPASGSGNTFSFRLDLPQQPALVPRSDGLELDDVEPVTGGGVGVAGTAPALAGSGVAIERVDVSIAGKDTKGNDASGIKRLRPLASDMLKQMHYVAIGLDPPVGQFQTARATLHFTAQEIGQDSTFFDLVTGEPLIIAGIVEQAAEGIRAEYNRLLDARRRTFPENNQPGSLGTNPLHLKSGYRSPERNAAISGSHKASAHMYGRAVDLVPGPLLSRPAPNILLVSLTWQTLTDAGDAFMPSLGGAPVSGFEARVAPNTLAVGGDLLFARINGGYQPGYSATVFDVVAQNLGKTGAHLHAAKNLK